MNLFCFMTSVKFICSLVFKMLYLASVSHTLLSPFLHVFSPACICIFERFPANFPAFFPYRVHLHLCAFPTNFCTFFPPACICIISLPAIFQAFFHLHNIISYAPFLCSRMLDFKEIKRGIGSLFDPCVNAMGWRPYRLSHMEDIYCTFRFGEVIRHNL